MIFKRRFIIYLKYFAILSLLVVYFGFLFNASLNAFQVRNGGNIRNIEIIKNEHKKRILKSKQLQKQLNLLQEEQKNAIEEEKKYKAEEKIRFVVDDDDDDSSDDTIKVNHVIENKSQVIIDKPLVNLTTPATTLNPVYEYSEELHNEIDKNLVQRKSHLQKICDRQNLYGIYQPQPREFFISSGHNLVWCNVFKAASSTWLFYFNLLAGYKFKNFQQSCNVEFARKKFPKPSSYELHDTISTALSFFIVREPFERLLSVYRDKFESYHRDTAKLNYKIKKIFRKIKGSESLQHREPTFEEFLFFIIYNAKLKQKLYEDHWTVPIYDLCAPCSINYTIIAKIETLQRDSEFIIRQAGLEGLLLGKLPKHKNQQTGATTTDLIERYFSKIDLQTLNELLKIYRLDFELFDYNYTKYYDIVKQPISTSHPNLTSPATLSSAATVDWNNQSANFI